MVTQPAVRLSVVVNQRQLPLPERTTEAGRSRRKQPERLKVVQLIPRRLRRQEQPFYKEAQHITLLQLREKDTHEVKKPSTAVKEFARSHLLTVETRLSEATRRTQVPPQRRRVMLMKERLLLSAQPQPQPSQVFQLRTLHEQRAVLQLRQERAIRVLQPLRTRSGLLIRKLRRNEFKEVRLPERVLPQPDLHMRDKRL